MPADRPGDPGSDTPQVAAGSRGPSRPPSGAGGADGAGPKRTPRPGQGSRRSPIKAAGAKGVAAKGSGAKVAGNRSGGDGNGSRAAARPSASSARVLVPAAPPAPSFDPPIGDDATAVTAFPAAPPAVVPAAVPVESVPAAALPPEEDDTRRRRGRRGRRVRRVVRRIELWSVLKLSLVLYTCLYLAVLGALIVVWGLAYSSGQIGNLQDFLADVGLENYRFYGNQMFRACAAIGAVGVLAGTIVTVFTAALVNLISEITGGIRLIVIEEEPPARR